MAASAEWQSSRGLRFGNGDEICITDTVFTKIWTWPPNYLLREANEQRGLRQAGRHRGERTRDIHAWWILMSVWVEGDHSPHCHRKDHSQLKVSLGFTAPQQNHTTDNCRNQQLCQETTQGKHPSHFGWKCLSLNNGFQYFLWMQKPRAFIVLGRGLHILVGADEELAQRQSLTNVFIFYSSWLQLFSTRLTPGSAI